MENLKFLHLKSVKIIRNILKLNAWINDSLLEYRDLEQKENKIHNESILKSINDQINHWTKLRDRFDEMYHNTHYRILEQYENYEKC